VGGRNEGKKGRGENVDVPMHGALRGKSNVAVTQWGLEKRHDFKMGGRGQALNESKLKNQNLNLKNKRDN